MVPRTKCILTVPPAASRSSLLYYHLLWCSQQHNGERFKPSCIDTRRSGFYIHQYHSVDVRNQLLLENPKVGDTLKQYWRCAEMPPRSFKFVPLFICSDPLSRLGSGGGTIHALYQYYLHAEKNMEKIDLNKGKINEWNRFLKWIKNPFLKFEEERQAQSIVGNSCPTLVDSFKEPPLILIHAGGCSRRLPGYSACGKMLVPLVLPCVSSSNLLAHNQKKSLKNDSAEELRCGDISYLFSYQYTFCKTVAKLLPPGLFSLIVACGDVALLGSERLQEDKTALHIKNRTDKITVEENINDSRSWRKVEGSDSLYLGENNTESLEDTLRSAILDVIGCSSEAPEERADDEKTSRLFTYPDILCFGLPMPMIDSPEACESGSALDLSFHPALSRHGVFVLCSLTPASGTVPNSTASEVKKGENRCKSDSYIALLQKPSPDKLRDWLSKTPPHSSSMGGNLNTARQNTFLLDVGIWVLSPRALRVLARKSVGNISFSPCMESSLEFSAQYLERDNCFEGWRAVDLYTDLLPTDTFISASFPAAISSEYNNIENENKSQKNDMGKLSVAVVPLPSTMEFLHFGSTAEILDSTRGLWKHCLSQQNSRLNQSADGSSSLPLWKSVRCNTFTHNEQSYPLYTKKGGTGKKYEYPDPLKKDFCSSFYNSWYTSSSIFPWHLFLQSRTDEDSSGNLLNSEWKASAGNDAITRTPVTQPPYVFVHSSIVCSNMKLSHHHVLTGIMPNNWNFSLPPYTCIDMIPLTFHYENRTKMSTLSTSRAIDEIDASRDSLTIALRPYHFHDNFKGSIAKSNDCTFLHAKSLWHWMKERGLSLEMLRRSHDAVSMYQGDTLGSDSIKTEDDFWKDACLFPTIVLHEKRLGKTLKDQSIEYELNCNKNLNREEDGMYWAGELLKWMVSPPPPEISSIVLADLPLCSSRLVEHNQDGQLRTNDKLLSKCEHWLHVRKRWIESRRLSAGEIQHFADINSVLRMNRDLAHFQANEIWKKNLIDEKESLCRNSSSREDIVFDYDELAHKCVEKHWNPLDSYWTSFCIAKGYSLSTFKYSDSYSHPLTTFLRDMGVEKPDSFTMGSEKANCFLWEEEKMSLKNQEILLMQYSVFFARVLQYAAERLRESTNNPPCDSLYSLNEQIRYANKLLQEIGKDSMHFVHSVSSREEKYTEPNYKSEGGVGDREIGHLFQKSNADGYTSEVDRYCNGLTLISKDILHLSVQMLRTSIVTPFFQRRWTKWIRRQAPQAVLLSAQNQESQTSSTLLRNETSEISTTTANGIPIPQSRNSAIEVVVTSPVRIDLCGGWTDTPPYSIWYGGSVINVAVDWSSDPRRKSHTSEAPPVPIQSYSPIFVHVYSLPPGDGVQRFPLEMHSHETIVSDENCLRMDNNNVLSNRCYSYPCIRVRSIDQNVNHYFSTFESIAEILCFYLNGSDEKSASTTGIPILALVLLGFLPRRLIPVSLLKYHCCGAHSSVSEEIISQDTAGTFPTLAAFLESLFDGAGIAIDINTNLPKGSGMGTSSILAASVIEALRVYCEAHGRLSRLYFSQVAAKPPEAIFEQSGISLCLNYSEPEMRRDSSATEINLSNIQRAKGEEENAGMALLLEQLLGAGGGWQDAYGGTVGGIKKIVYNCNVSTDEDHFLQPTVWGAFPPPINTQNYSSILFTHPLLQPCHLLYFTGITRKANSILSEIVHDTYIQKKSVMTTFSKINGLVHRMEQLLLDLDSLDLRADGRFKNDFSEKELFSILEKYGKLIQESWSCNKAFDHGVSTPYIDCLLAVLQPYIFGAKLCGAGGGGYLYMVAKNSESARIIVNALESQKVFEEVTSDDGRLSSVEEGVKEIRSRISLYPGGYITPFTLAHEGMKVKLIRTNTKKN